MSQSLYTAMGGISAAQTMLEVVSDNIANINTTAYKESEITFENLFSKTLTSGTSASNVTGGTNPIQIGLGVQVSSISKNFTSGTWTATGQANDLMIEGDGFFVVRDSEGNSFLTKAGDFSVDSKGNLVTSGGYYVVGTDDLYATTTGKSNVKIPQSISSTLKPEVAFAAQDITKLNNLVDGEVSDGTAIVDVTVGGVTQAVSINIDGDTDTTMQSIVNKITAALSTTNITIGGTVHTLDDYVSVSAATGGKIIFTVTDESPAALTSLNFDKASTSNLFLTTGLSGADETNTATGGTYASNVLDFTVEIAPATSLTDTISLDSYSIQEDGSIACTYSNGDSLTVALNSNNQKYEFKYTTSDNVIITGNDVNCNPNVAVAANMVIQLADVTNEDGLISIGSNMYETGQNSGAMSYSVGGSMGMGSISSGGLESSNVDLSKQFSNMIVAQRAIQANSRVFSTSSDILETLVNLGR